MDEMPKCVPLKLADRTVVGRAVVIPDGQGQRIVDTEIDDPAVLASMDTAKSGDFSFQQPRPRG